MLSPEEEFVIHRSVEEDYDVHELVGSGSYASVFRGTDKKTNERVAIKRINKFRLLWSALRTQKIDLMAEVEVMKRLKHPFLINLYRVYETGKEIALVMEFAEGGELIKRVRDLGCYPEPVARDVIERLLIAVQYMHSQGTTHRDIKPENLVLMSKDSLTDVKLADFGLSKFSNENMKTFVGTPRYIAPEILHGQQYGKEVDVWAVGVVAAFLLTGSIPFVGETPEELYNRIQSGDICITEEQWSKLSEDARDFVQHMLCVQPSARLSVQQALQHRWIHHINTSPTLLLPSGSNLSTTTAQKNVDLASVTVFVPDVVESKPKPHDALNMSTSSLARPTSPPPSPSATNSLTTTLCSSDKSLSTSTPTTPPPPVISTVTAIHSPKRLSFVRSPSAPKISTPQPEYVDFIPARSSSVVASSGEKPPGFGPVEDLAPDTIGSPNPRRAFWRLFAGLYGWPNAKRRVSRLRDSFRRPSSMRHSQPVFLFAD